MFPAVAQRFMLARSLAIMGITSASALSLSATSTASDVVARYRPSLPSYVARGGVAVVTGGNSGIGAESARALLDVGCFVVLACRDAAAGERALAEMGAAAGRARVQKLDLADLDSVSAACREIAQKEGRVSLLLNNAGVMATPQQKTKQGFELQIGTNHLGHFALTRLLLPLIEDDGRVVTVASTAHTMGSVDSADLNFAERKYTPWGAYGQSKAANILFAKGLADLLEEAGSNVLSVSLHPGVIGTPLWRHNNWLLTKLFLRFITNKDVPQGASTSLYACLAEGIPAGSYLSDCAVATPNEACEDRDGALRKALWAQSEKLVAEAGLALPERLLLGEREAAPVVA
jgi:NAD(P)-dependent dehydrogenase (short-subunit alcohol dehydrogenase family)